MTKLKTLKDIEEEYCDMTCGFNERLKSEAIKWVKDCSGTIKWKDNKKRCEGCQWFIKFFNLTEADIKEDTRQ
jgi:hypothetical protein